MPLVVTDLDANQFIQRFKAGATFAAIAAEFGVCDRTVMERMHRAGFRARSWLQAERERIAREVYPAHEAGESMLSISARTGVDRGTLTRTMRRLGLPVRDCSDAQRARMSKLTAAERRAHVAAANFVARVREIPLPEKVKRAATRTRKVGMHERELVESLRAAGVECEHQFPIGPYNVDIWLAESRVAVEVYRTHPGRALMARLHKRTEYLLDGGRHQLTVQLSYPRGTPFDLAAVRDKVIAFAQFCSRHHPSGGQHGVIRGNGEFVARSSHQTHGRPLVVGLDAG
jgi:very-short-patch-repair endonuclease